MTKDRKLRLSGVAALASVTSGLYAGCTPESQEAEMPNVIVILADDLGYGDLECYGAENVQTPNVNALSENGVRFLNAHATASTSTPSRYSLLTGEYAWRKPDTDIAAGDASMIIKPEQPTMADMFKSVGYETCVIGKWHLGLGAVAGQQDWNKKITPNLSDLGFDYSYIMAATSDRVPCVFIENGEVANYDESAPIHVSYSDNFPGEPTGYDNPELLYNLKSSQGHAMSIVNGIGRIGYMKGGGAALWKDENIADSITVHAVDFIKQHADKPFFMYFATNDIHVPRFPHERFRGTTSMGLRGDAISEFDWSVGMIINALKEEGIYDNTLVILSSDNGPVIDDGYQDRARELLNGHKPAGKLRGGKYSSLEGGTMVPFIVSWPLKIKCAKSSEALVSQVDIFRSLAELIGAKTDGMAPDSRNFLKTVIGESGKGAPWVIEQSYDHVLSIRTRKWKYIEPSDGPSMIDWGPEIETGNLNEPQLYRMDDSVEKENVASKHPLILYYLRHLLRSQF